MTHWLNNSFKYTQATSRAMCWRSQIFLAISQSSTYLSFHLLTPQRTVFLFVLTQPPLRLRAASLCVLMVSCWSKNSGQQLDKCCLKLAWGWGDINPKDGSASDTSGSTSNRAILCFILEIDPDAVSSKVQDKNIEIHTLSRAHVKHTHVKHTQGPSGESWCNPPIWFGEAHLVDNRCASVNHTLPNQKSIPVKHSLSCLFNTHYHHITPDQEQ